IERYCHASSFGHSGFFRHSSFVIRHSSFVIRHSSFEIPMSQAGKRPDYLLGNTLNDLFMSLPKSEIRQIASEVHAECMRRGITYIGDDNTMRVIPLMLRPTL